MEYQKVSIIIPIYNTASFLDRCLASLTGQTYKNIEILAVNNGSQDESLNVLKKWEMKDTRIQVITKPHGLAASARNKGLDCATGEYIMFVDSDDYVRENYVETLYRAINDNHAEIAQCCFCKVVNGVEMEYLPYDENRVYTGRELSILQASFVGLSTPQTVLWNKIYRRSVFETLRFREDREYEDINLARELLYDKKCIAWIPDSLYCWVIHEGSHTTSSVYREQRTDEVWAYVDRVDYYHENGDAELEWLNRKRCFYVAAQHIYNMKKIKGNKDKIDALYKIIYEYYPEIKKKKSGIRSQARWIFIRFFPAIFGKISLRRKLDFQI